MAGRVAHHLGRARRALALLGEPRAHAQPSSDLEARFRARAAQLDAPRVLELGVKRSIADRSTLHRDWFPTAREHVGTDVQPGVDVDVVADVHRLSEAVGRESFDVVLSASTLEHVKYPWVAAHEIMRTLRVGGMLYLQTQHTFPLHGFPQDFYRFSREALASLFPASMGMEVVATNYDFPVVLHSRRVADLHHHPAWLNSTVWAEKRAATPDDWRLELDDVVAR